MHYVFSRLNSLASVVYLYNTQMFDGLAGMVTTDVFLYHFFSINGAIRFSLQRGILR